MTRGLCFAQYGPLSCTSFLSRQGFSSSGSLQRLHFAKDAPPHKRGQSSAFVRRSVISASSLEESKRRAKSQYDNIPDLNQQYISELSWAERKYGPKRLKKDISKEVQKSILKPVGVIPPRQKRAAQSTDNMSPSLQEGEPDISGYNNIRNQLIGNTLFIGALGICAMWGFGSLKNVQSYAVGLLGSLAYVVLLARSVDRVAEAARKTGVGAGDALQPARVAILVILVIASAKNSDKLDVLPVLFGFFTYKAATLLPLLTGEAFE